MGLAPDNLLIQSIALSYFAAGVWLFAPMIAVSAVVHQRMMIIVGIVLAASAILWLYLFITVLQAHIQSIHGVMLAQGLLIIVTASALMSQSFSAVRQRVSQIVLALLLLGLPVLYLWLLKSFGLSLLGWLPILLETKWPVFVLILALALYLIVYASSRWRTAAILLLLFGGSLIMMLGALITMAFPTG